MAEAPNPFVADFRPRMSSDAAIAAAPPPGPRPERAAAPAADKAKGAGPDAALDNMFSKFLDAHDEARAAKADRAADRAAEKAAAKAAKAANDDEPAAAESGDKRPEPRGVEKKAEADPRPGAAKAEAETQDQAQDVAADAAPAATGVTPPVPNPLLALQTAPAAETTVETEAAGPAVAKATAEPSATPPTAEDAAAAALKALAALDGQPQAAPQPEAADAAKAATTKPEAPAAPPQPQPQPQQPAALTVVEPLPVEAPPAALQAAAANLQAVEAPAQAPVAPKGQGTPGVRLVSAGKGPQATPDPQGRAIGFHTQSPFADPIEAGPGPEVGVATLEDASAASTAATPDAAEPAAPELTLDTPATTTAQAATPERIALRGDLPAAAAQATASTAPSLAAAMVQKLEARSSRFELELDPAGLGKVKVSVQIDSQGRLNAQLAFDRPDAAAALRDRAAELKTALQDAGFDLGGGGLSFTSSGEGRDQASSGQQGARHAAARLFAQGAEALETADLSAAPGRRLGQRNLDLRI